MRIIFVCLIFALAILSRNILTTKMSRFMVCTCSPAVPGPGSHTSSVYQCNTRNLVCAHKVRKLLRRNARNPLFPMSLTTHSTQSYSVLWLLGCNVSEHGLATTKLAWCQNAIVVYFCSTCLGMTGVIFMCNHKSLRY